MRIKFERKDVVPDVEFEMTIFETLASTDYIVRAQLVANGSDLRRLLKSFRIWTECRHLRPTITQKPGTARLEIFFEEWAAVSDFLVWWLGDDVFQIAIQKACDVDARIGQEVRGLRKQMAGLSAQLSRLQEKSDCRDRHLRAALATLLDSETIKAENDPVLSQ